MTVKKFVYLNVIGDGVHNLIDGMIIAASFFINITVGLATTVAVIFHELPQEIGDFGVRARSYGWEDGAVKTIEERLEKAGMEIVASALTVKWVPDKNEI